ncbi:MAG: S-layer homology domain-containing protein [Oscillospiraceae bacterium]|nr:S-layer homology domain-containing protein [Oscillospiraceae bacterium]
MTRAEFATLAAHFDNLSPAGGNQFKDVANTHWAVKYINSAAAKGWIAGYPDGTFKPEANITRAEVVTLVNRILARKADQTYIDANPAKLPRGYSDLQKGHWAYWDIMEASVGHDYIKGASGETWTTVYE